MLDKYFAEGPYRFQMQFGRGTFREFYGPTSEHGEILAERRAWLKRAPDQYLSMLPEADPLLDEASEMGVRHETLPDALPHDREERALFLGENWEADYLLLTRESNQVRLVGGCVCFPSSWALESKIGRPIEEIHGIVPTLNTSIGPQIHTFLEKLKPEICWTRSNWGLSRSAERNQHPSRRLSRLDANVALDELFFRVEEQSLVALPGTGGILFGIRIVVFPLREFIGQSAAGKLSSTIETMPEAIAEYKGIAPARRRILELLGNSGRRESKRR